MKIIVVGGVAAGASAAARLRRLDETAEIVLLERGEVVSYANCGLPYYLGRKISRRDSLLVMTPEKFRSWFNIDVRTRSEAIRVDRKTQTVAIRGERGEYTERYDKLLLAPGSSPIDQSIPGAENDPRITHLWTIADMDRIDAAIEAGVKRAIVVGAGFIGLETAENLLERGIAVSIVQRGDHVLPTVDRETSVFLASELARLGVDLILNQTITSFEKEDDRLIAVLGDGRRLETDLVVVGTGVRPNSELAVQAGLDCGPRGHILVNEHLQTSDPNIYAAGDAVEVVDPVFGGKTSIPLAGPANKQGRIVADHMTGRPSTYRGTLGTSVVRVGSLVAASVGWTGNRLRQAGREFHTVYIHPNSNASYFPGGDRMHLKLMFDAEGKILGAQIVGGIGVDKRIDAIAQAMYHGMKAADLGKLELAYAPPFSSAKDPINYAGFVAENVLSGLTRPIQADAIPSDAIVLDVREPEEFNLGAVPGAVNISLGELRNRLDELDRSRKIVVYCQVGLRGYLAERILRQNDFDVYNLSGGYSTWTMFHPNPVATVDRPQTKSETSERRDVAAEKLETLDVRGLPCPGPVIALKKAFDATSPQERRRVFASASFENDLVRWAQGNGHRLLSVNRATPGEIEAILEKGTPNETSVATSSCSTSNCPTASGTKSAAIVLFSNDLDKALAAMIIANGFAASGVKTSVFFTFWGLTVLRKNPSVKMKKNFISRMFGRMLPRGAEKLVLSKMNLMGMGTAMMKSVMKSKNVLSLPELIQSAKENGVRFIACEMAMDVMGLNREELIGVDEVVSVASFIELAKNGQNTLFI